MTFEIRTADLWPDVDFEIRAAPDGFTFEGYAAVYNKPSVPMAFPGIAGGRRFREVIHPGAFTATLAGSPDVTLRYQHNMNTLPLARTKGGTMTLSEDDRGLRVQAMLPDNEWGRPMRDAISRGDISGMSFRFGNAVDDWSQDGKMRVRNLRKVDLGPEVSITDIPAYPDTEAMVRAAAAALEIDPDEALEALKGLAEGHRFTPEQTGSLVETLAKHAEPVIPVSVVHTLREKRERLDALR